MGYNLSYFRNGVLSLFVGLIFAVVWGNEKTAKIEIRENRGLFSIKPREIWEKFFQSPLFDLFVSQIRGLEG